MVEKPAAILKQYKESRDPVESLNTASCHSTLNPIHLVAQVASAVLSGSINCHWFTKE